MSNVDTAEIQRFENLASTWWDPQGGMAPLHHLNGPRLQFIEHACGGLRGKRAVDVGCGGGLLTEGMSARGASVTGIDLAQAALEVARLHGLESGVRADYRLISAESLADEQPAHYDLVCCLEMLEHVPDPAAIVRACAELCKPGGNLVFSTINRTLKAYALAIVGAEYVAGLLPRGTHEYGKFIRPSELDSWCRQAGLEAVEMAGLRYNPVLKSAVVCDDIDVNYLLHCRKPAA